MLPAMRSLLSFIACYLVNLYTYQVGHMVKVLKHQIKKLHLAKNLLV